MKILLDENIPKKLLGELPGHEIYSSLRMKWTGYKNGELINMMIEKGFGALITFDKNIRYQQNFSKYPIIVFLLVSEKNTYEKLSPLMPKVAKHLKSKPRPGVIIVS